jgi:general secretion pathway protein A
MDYLEFFDLKEDPFRLTPDPVYFYPSASHNEAMSSLNYMVQQKEGFFLATGEPGTGKTTLLNVFLTTDMWKDRAGIALVLTPRLSPEEFLLTVLEDLNVKVKNTNKNEIIKAFRDFLIENSMLGRRVIIIVDESQNLPDETLEELRLLSNLETEKEKLLQIVLIGQPELRKRLLSDNLKQLNQRITVRATLKPLTRDETADYIAYRLVKAGKGNAAFEERTKKVIYEMSKGIPRLINLISSRAMMAAYLDLSRQIKPRHVNYAAKHLSEDYIKKGSSITFKMILWLLLFCIAGFGIALNYRPDMLEGLWGVERREDAPAIGGPALQVLEKESAAAARKEERKRTAVVIVNSATLRAKPSAGSEPVRWASKGDVFEVIAEAADEAGAVWYKVKSSEEKESWISAKTVTIEE